MIFGTQEKTKDGVKTGYLRFDTGKIIELTNEELGEMIQKIRIWQAEARIKMEQDGR